MTHTANPFFVGAIALALLTSAGACTEDVAGVATVVQPPAPLPEPAKPNPPAPLETLPAKAARATLSPEQRARDEAALQALIRRATESPPPPRVLFDIEVAACCCGLTGKHCMSDCSKANALFYEDPGGQAWGLGSLFVDWQHRIWIHDSVATRAVAFDQKGELKSVVPTGEHGYEAEELLAVTSDEVRFWAPWKGGAISRFGLDGTYRGTTEVGSLLDSEAGRALWTLADEKHRFIPRASETYAVTDITLNGATASFAPVRALKANGRTYSFACDKSGTEYRGTLTIGPHSVAVPGCPTLSYLGPDGSVIVGNARYDANATLTGVLIAPELDAQLGLGDRGPIAIGPDGRAYSYAALKKVVRFVELAFTTP